MIKTVIMLLCAYSVSAATFYISPTGSSGNTGAIDSPWSLRHAITNAGMVSAGDEILLRGGYYYTGQTNVWPYTANCTLSGTAENYITIKSFENETATINPGLYHTTGNYVEFRGLRFTNSSARLNDYVGRPAGLGIGGRDRVINCEFFDTGHPSVVGSGAEIYGNILRGCGIFEYDNIAHFYTNPWTRGSALYLQNSSASGTLVQDNISSGSLNAGMKAYAESGNVQNFTFDNNVSFLNNGEGIEVECLFNSISNAWVWNNNTYRCLKNPMGYYSDRVGDFYERHGSLTYSNNYDYGSPGAGVAVLWMTRWSNIVCLGNTIVATSQTNEWFAGSGVGLGMSGKFIDLEPVTNVVINYNINSNSYYGGREQAGPYYDQGIFQGQYTPFYVVQAMPYDGTFGQMPWSYWTNTYDYDRQGSYTTNLPTGNTVIIRTNKYAPGRAHIVVWNWESNNTVTVSCSGLNLNSGQRFEVRDVQNWFGAPVMTTNYSPGLVIDIPLTGTNVSAIAGSGFAESFTFNPNIHTASLFNVFVILPLSNTALRVNTVRAGTVISQ